MRTSLLIPAICVLLLAACGSKDVTVEDPPIGGQSFQQMMPINGKVSVPEHGEEVWFAYGAMKGNDFSPANGVVSSHRFEDGATIVTMQLNVAIPKEGSFYEVWLMDPATNQSISAGHLKNSFGDVRHGIRFESKEDLRSHTQVRITLEKDDGDTTASTNVVATGLLVKTKRK